MKPERLARRWKRRHQRLLAELEKQLRLTRRRGGAEAVHTLRVTLRRLRLSLRLGKALFDEELRGKWRAWARRISCATSPVRDLDIAVEWLVANRANPALIQEAQRLRERTWRRRQRQIAPPPRGLLARLERPARPEDGPQALARRFQRLEARYRDHLRAQLPQFFDLGEDERHDFRRTVRWWRYLRELVVPRKKLKSDPVCRRLLPAQETLGEMQNLALVQSTLTRLTASPERDELLGLLTRQQQAQLDLARAALRGLKKVLN
jgi:CHAD domain-containing protein